MATEIPGRLTAVQFPPLAVFARSVVITLGFRKPVRYVG